MEGELLHHQTKKVKRFRYMVKKKMHFWNRWCREYLIHLREHHKIGKCGSTVEMKVGHLMLVKEVGKVEELTLTKVAPT